jgi:arylsulfatase B
MRGKKTSEYDGGHRVPFFAHWPAAGWSRKHVCDTLTHAVDIVPTLLDVTGATTPTGLKFDGRSIRALLDPAATGQPWPDRFLVTDSQRVRDPIKWKQTAVMAQEWRLVNGRELYAIKSDPGQARDVAKDHPGQVAKMRAFYDAWWAELEPTFAQTTEIYLGHPAHPVVSLTGHDWIQEELPPWNQQHIRQAQGLAVMPKPGKGPAGNAKSAAKPAATKSVHLGHWAVKVVRAGTYEISLRRWPVEADRPITAGLPAASDVPGATPAYRARNGVAVPAVTAALRLDGQTLGTKPVAAGDTHVTFTTRLTAGSHQLAPVFTLADGGELGAYYAVVTTVRQP